MSETGYLAPLAGRGVVLIPEGVARVPGGVWLHAACRPSGLLAAWLLGTSTRLLVRPVSRRVDPPPLPALDWEEWAASWLPDAATPNRWVVGLPMDQRRRRFHLLIPGRDDRPLAFAKFTTNSHSPEVLRVREIMDIAQPDAFWTPRLVGHGTVDGWAFTIDEAMPTGFHRPARLPPAELRRIVTEIQQLLVFPLSPPDGWVGLHGDFGPWNVRALGSRTVVLDWEEVTVGPPLADELWHALNMALLRRGRAGVAGRIARSLDGPPHESIVVAARFLLERLARPEPGEVRRDVRLSDKGTRFLEAQRRVLGSLAGM